jgi:hypothetical protein
VTFAVIRHRAAVVRELRCIVKQVGQDLNEPCRIDIDDATGRLVDRRSIRCVWHQGGAIRFDSAVDQVRQQCWFSLEHDLARVIPTRP